MKDNTWVQFKQRNEVKNNAKSIEKRIKFLQRELVRASFQGDEKIGLCKKILTLLKRERMKIQVISQGKPY